MKLDYKKIKDAIVTALAGAAAIGVWNFYHDWTIDESTEEGQMFDSAAQKAETINHIRKIDPVELEVKIQRDADFQAEVLKELKEVSRRQKHMDSVSNLNADQIYQIKEEFKQRHE